MMALIEHKLKQLTKIFMIFILVSCQVHGDKINEPILECLLDNYISAFSIDENTTIFISNMKGWTDSTSVIRLLSFQDEKESSHIGILQSTYKKIDILLEDGKLLDSEIVLNKDNIERSIPNNLKWEKVIQNKSIKNDSKITPPEEFDEIQLAYNPSKKCFEKLILTHSNFKKKFESNCNLCKN